MTHGEEQPDVYPATRNTRLARLLLLLAGLMLCGVALAYVRVPGALKRSLWLDEFITYEVAQLPLFAAGQRPSQTGVANSIASFVARDTGMGPLGYVWDGMFAKRVTLFGGEIWLRVPGLVASAAACLIAGLLVFVWGGGVVTVTAGMLLAAVYPPFASASVGSRGYALAQFIVLTTILLYAWDQRNATRWRAQRGVGMILLAIVGVLVHPLCIIAPAGVLLACVIKRERNRHSAVVTPPNLAEAAVAMIAAMASAALTYRGAFDFASKHSAATSHISERVYAQITQFVAELVQTGTGILWAITCAIALTLIIKKRATVSSHLGALFLGLLIATAGSVVVLALGFELRLRYLFVFETAVFALWLRFLVVATQENLTKQLRWLRQSVAAVVFVTTAAMTALSAAENRREMQDWKSAVTDLRSRVKESDIIIAGPHSEHTALIQYAIAASIPNVITGTVTTADGVFSVSEIAGIEALMHSGRRVWLVTSFWHNPVRSADYWKILENGTQEVIRFPGTLPIVIRRTRND